MNTLSSNLCLNNCGAELPVGPGATRKFCSRSCANSYNNTLSPKRLSSYPRCSCGAILRWKGVTSCVTCRSEEYSNTTIGDLKKKSTRDAQVYNSLRQRSRKLAKALGLNSCEVCGYDNHFEVCHIIDLAKLPNETTVEDATARTNFYVLCPNHHWELDNADAVGIEPTGV